jgi:phosphate-selective porin OprO/OprP
MLSYTRLGIPGIVKVPVQGGHVALGYFLTGEEVERRTVVEPLRPFDPVAGRWGTGALEPFVRYSQMDLGEEVFSAGLADPTKWSRSAYMTDVGFNWYPNRFIKCSFDWQHTAFGTPVLLNEAKGYYGNAVDLFWVRCQLWY